MDKVEVTKRAAEVLRKGLEAARLDPSEIGVRIWLAGSEARTGFADEPESGDATITADGLTLYLDASVTAAGPVAVDVSAEHERIVVVPLDD